MKATKRQIAWTVNGLIRIRETLAKEAMIAGRLPQPSGTRRSAYELLKSFPHHVSFKCIAYNRLMVNINAINAALRMLSETDA